MKFIDFIKGGFFTSFKRFPVAYTIVLYALFVGFRLVYLSYDSSDHINYELKNQMEEKLIFVLVLCNFSSMLSLAFDLFCEKNNRSALLKWGLRIFTVLLGVLLFLFMDVVELNTNKIRLVVLCVSAHFAISSFPFIFKKHWTEFWDFNKELFLRIQLSLFYSLVLFLGLSLAVLAQDQLLKLYDGGDIYGYLAVLIFIGFNTIFFMSGIPRLSAHQETEYEYPIGLKIFAAYVILPLVALYLIILLLFEIRILGIGEMQEGFVSWMIFCFAVAGILAFLLLYPIIGNKENIWIKISFRVFSFSLIPLLILLWWAIYIRIAEYGWTELRYIHTLLSLWLTFFVIYFIIKNDKAIIKWLPLSISIMGFLISVGPWGYSSVARNSQKSFIDDYLETRDSAQGTHIISKIEYLHNNHGFESVREYITEAGQAQVDSILKLPNSRIYKYEVSNIAQDHFITELPEQNFRYTNFNQGNIQYIDINLADEIYQIEPYKNIINISNDQPSITFPNHDLTLKSTVDDDNISIQYKGLTEVINIQEYMQNNIEAILKYQSVHTKIDSENNPDMKFMEILLFDGQMKIIFLNMGFEVNIEEKTISNFWGVKYMILFN